MNVTDEMRVYFEVARRMNDADVRLKAARAEERAAFQAQREVEAEFRAARDALSDDDQARIGQAILQQAAEGFAHFVKSMATP